MAQSASAELLSLAESLQPVAEEDLHIAYMRRLKQRTDPRSASLLFHYAFNQLLGADVLQRDGRGRLMLVPGAR